MMLAMPGLMGTLTRTHTLTEMIALPSTLRVEDPATNENAYQNAYVDGGDSSVEDPPRPSLSAFFRMVSAEEEEGAFLGV